MELLAECPLHETIGFYHKWSRGYSHNDHTDASTAATTTTTGIHCGEQQTPTAALLVASRVCTVIELKVLPAYCFFFLSAAGLRGLVQYDCTKKFMKSQKSDWM
jgi:hypothetical protein